MNGQTAQLTVKTRRKTVAERRFSRPAKIVVEEIKESVWPRVDLSAVFPKSLTCEEVSLTLVSH